MPELPHGWRVRNSAGEVKGPPPVRDDSDSEVSEYGEDGQPLDIRPDSPGWEDVEDDTEALNIKCLLCDANFPGAKAMLHHCTEAHSFDFLAVQRQYSMLALIKLPQLLASSH